MRLLAIGDIHGCVDKLTNLLAKVAVKIEDRVIFLGDYIDRGPASKDVINKLLAFKKVHPDTIFLRGNHEQMLLDCLTDLNVINDWKRLSEYPYPFLENPDYDNLKMYLANGGTTTLASYGIDIARLKMSPVEAFSAFTGNHLDFLRKLVTWYEYDRYFFVHAGIDRDDPYGIKCGPFFHLWERDEIPFNHKGKRMIVVHGHTPTKKMSYNVGRGNVNLDTGAVYGRTLTCCDLLSRRLWQA